MAEPDTPQPVRSKSTWLKALYREPLGHFLLLAGLLFLAQVLLRGDPRELIHVDRATQLFLVEQEADLRLRPLTAAEAEAVVAAYVDEEILFREAKRRGFQNSARVRKLLVQNMRFLLAEELPSPTEAELRRYFDSQRERFNSPATITLDNLHFRDAAAVPPGILARLQEGAQSGQLGDDTAPGERRLYDMSQRRLAGYFGPEGAQQVLAITGDEWVGPIPSPRGVHFLRVAERAPASEVGFDQVRRWLEADWQAARQREMVEQELVRMRGSYRVVLEPAAQDTVDD
jgi:hypothetical protein